MKAGRSYAGFNPASGPDVKLFRAVLDGNHLLRGFRNADIREALYGTTDDRGASSPKRGGGAFVEAVTRARTDQESAPQSPLARESPGTSSARSRAATVSSWNPSSPRCCGLDSPKDAHHAQMLRSQNLTRQSRNQRGFFSKPCE